MVRSVVSGVHLGVERVCVLLRRVLRSEARVGEASGAIHKRTVTKLQGQNTSRKKEFICIRVEG